MYNTIYINISQNRKREREKKVHIVYIFFEHHRISGKMQDHTLIIVNVCVYFF